MEMLLVLTAYIMCKAFSSLEIVCYLRGRPVHLCRKLQPEQRVGKPTQQATLPGGWGARDGQSTAYRGCLMLIILPKKKQIRMLLCYNITLYLNASAITRAGRRAGGPVGGGAGGAAGHIVRAPGGAALRQRPLWRFRFFGSRGLDV